MRAGQQPQLKEDAAASDDDDIRSELALDLEGMQNAFQEASLQGELDAIGLLFEQARPLVGHPLLLIAISVWVLLPPSRTCPNVPCAAARAGKLA
jgi:hypothetical protein